MSIVDEALAKLKIRCDEIKFEDDFDLVTYVQLSSRMKALGDSSYYNKLDEILKKDQYRGRLDDILIQACKQLMAQVWDQAGNGEWGAYPVIECQDLYCFRQFTKDLSLYDKNTGPYMDQLLDETSLAPVDQEKAAVLRDWLETYPIPEELRLPVVDSPVTDWDYEVLGKIASFLPQNTTVVTWQKPE